MLIRHQESIFNPLIQPHSGIRQSVITPTYIGPMTRVGVGTYSGLDKKPDRTYQ